MTKSWHSAGSILMRHFLPKSCRLSRVCCNAATFSRRSLESARVYTVVSSAKELSRVSETRHLSMSATYSRKVSAPARYLEEHHHESIAEQKSCPQLLLGGGDPPGSPETQQSGTLWPPLAGACELSHYAILYQTPSNIYCNDGYSAGICDRLRPFELKCGKKISSAAALTKPIQAVRKEVVVIHEGNKLTVHDGFHNLR